MTTALWVTLLASAIAFMASVVSAGVAIYNARLGRFVSERWWEHTVTSYSNVVQHLVKVKNAADAVEAELKESADAALPSGQLELARLKSLAAYAQSLVELQEAELREILVLPAESIAEVSKCSTELIARAWFLTDGELSCRTGDISAMTDRARDLTQDVVLKLRAQARKHLGVKRG